MSTGEEFARDLAEHSEAKQAAGVRQERKSSRRERLITWVVVLLVLGWAYNAWGNARLDAAAEAAEVGAEQRQEEIDQAFADRDAASAERGKQLEAILAQQAAYGKSVTASDLAAAIDAVETTDPALQSTLSLLAEQVAALEAESPKTGPKGDPGETGDPGPTGEPGVPGDPGLPGEAGQNGQDGAPGANGATPSVTAALVDGHLVITIDGTPYDLGSVVGPKGDTGAAGPSGATGPSGPSGPKGDPGILPGTYSCADGQYMTGLTVSADGTATALCAGLPAPAEPETPTDPGEQE